MYDYVIQLSFQKEIRQKIQNIKEILKKNKVIDKERDWKPHITIDLYNCSNEIEFISKLDLIVRKIRAFNIKFDNLNNFNEETLYIEPFNKQKLYEIKSLFDSELEIYRLEHRKKRIYRPHITLCTNDNLTKAKKIADEIFEPFEANIKYLWVYNQNMDLIKEYELI